MKTATTQIFSFGIVALLLSGCYTQLEVVERPGHHFDRYERPAPNRAYNPQDEYRLDEHGYVIDEFSEESYLAGYDDGFTDVELHFRDFSRQPVFGNTNQYALGYRDGFRDASWTYNRHRFHSRYSSWHWNPYWHSSWHSGWHAGWHSGWHSSFHASWGWHRPHSFWYGSPYHFHGYYAHPVYFHGFHPHYGWGVHRNTWIVYNHNVINNTTVNRGPRNSGIQRDRHNTSRNVAAGGNRTDARPSTSATRSSGVSRDNTGVQRGTATTTTGRDRGTVTRSPSTDGRSSGTTRSGVREGGSSSGSSGSVQRGTSSGRSSGTVRSGGNRSGSSSSGNTTRRPRGNEMQSSNQLPAVSPGSTNSRERLMQERPVVQQSPRTTTQQSRTRINTATGAPQRAPQPGRTHVTRDNDRPTSVTRNATGTVQSSPGSTVTRSETAAPARFGNTGSLQQRPTTVQSAGNTNSGVRTPPRQQQTRQSAPAPRQQPATRQAPAPQRSQPAASPQRNTSSNESRSTNRTRNRD
ncbi:MAG: hypothetical protein JJU41_09150 [Bacteroidetes bacterium]|nr:hypothetical protein [Bacteroidota bacterium]MCH8524792.1 hypothetical protein [Balneolales bacterium]